MSFKTINKRETLAEQVCNSIQNAIIQGDFKPGSTLPTEPELEKQFAVSRAVIRDAVQMLKAKGLIDVKHGKGMYVSQSQHQAFAEALTIALQRDDSKAWDVEEFESIMLPAIASLNSQKVSEQQLACLQDIKDSYMEIYSKLVHEKIEARIAKLENQCKELYESFMNCFFSISDNKMIALLGPILVHMRKWRDIVDLKDLDNLIKIESKGLQRFIDAISFKNHNEAFNTLQKNYKMNSSIQRALKSTRIGESPQIAEKDL